VTVNEDRSIRKRVMPKEEPLFPTGAVLVDTANLGLEKGSGSGAVGKREGVVSGTVVVHGGLSEC
jgi:hypothetical protein